MSRVLACCRWCAGPVADTGDELGRGRPPTYCSDEHRDAYRRAFRCARWDGAIQLEAGCRCHGVDSVDLPGPVRGPGAYVDAYAQVLAAIYGHPVTATVAPVDVASLDSGATVALDLSPHRQERTA